MSKGKPKPPRLRKLKVVPEVIDIHAEIDEENDRTAAVVSVAYVENNLVLAIKSRLRELDDTAHNIIFEDDHAAFRDFSAKIDIGYALNLYDDNVRKDLHRLRGRFERG